MSRAMLAAAVALAAMDPAPSDPESLLARARAQKPKKHRAPKAKRVARKIQSASRRRNRGR